MPSRFSPTKSANPQAQPSGDLTNSSQIVKDQAVSPKCISSSDPNAKVVDVQGKSGVVELNNLMIE